MFPERPTSVRPFAKVRGQSHVNGSAIRHHHLLRWTDGLHVVRHGQIWGYEICPGRQIPDREATAIVYLYRKEPIERSDFSRFYIQPGICRQLAVDNFHRAVNGRRAVSNNQAHSSDLFVSIDRYSIRGRCVWILDPCQTKPRFRMVDIKQRRPCTQAFDRQSETRRGSSEGYRPLQVQRGPGNHPESDCRFEIALYCWK